MADPAKDSSPILRNTGFPHGSTMNRWPDVGGLPHGQEPPPPWQLQMGIGRGAELSTPPLGLGAWAAGVARAAAASVDAAASDSGPATPAPASLPGFVLGSPPQMPLPGSPPQPALPSLVGQELPKPTMEQWATIIKLKLESMNLKGTLERRRGILATMVEDFEQDTRTVQVLTLRNRELQREIAGLTESFLDLLGGQSGPAEAVHGPGPAGAPGEHGGRAERPPAAARAAAAGSVAAATELREAAAATPWSQPLPQQPPPIAGCGASTAAAGGDGGSWGMDPVHRGILAAAPVPPGLVRVAVPKSASGSAGGCLPPPPGPKSSVLGLVPWLPGPRPWAAAAAPSSAAALASAASASEVIAAGPPPAAAGATAAVVPAAAAAWWEQPQMQLQQPKRRWQPPQQEQEQWPLRPIPPDATTLVVRNLPASCSQERLLAIWPPDGSWDYFHCPYNLLHQRQLGFVFINFLSHELAVAFQARWHGRTLPSCSRRRLLDVVPAELQGQRALLSRVRTRKLSHFARAGYLPVVLVGGQRLGVPELIEQAVRDGGGDFVGGQGEDEDAGEPGPDGEGELVGEPGPDGEDAGDDLAGGGGEDEFVDEPGLDSEVVAAEGTEEAEMALAGVEEHAAVNSEAQSSASNQMFA